MKTTLAWLKTHLETDAPLAAIVDRLIMLGHDIEAVEERARGLEPFIIARVVSAERHPSADRLQLCLVDTGAERVQVVCGAPNARAGIKAVFAPPGTVIPRTGTVLQEARIRGVLSHGMLCSAWELGLGEDREGIIELPDSAPVGARYAGFLGLDDPVLDIKVTPNRADCLGVRGIARDLAASGLGRLKPLDTGPVAARFRSPIGIRIEDRSACPLFLGRHLRGVRNGPSPPWLARRLEAIGLRPISALVDLTNFLTYDLNRPLHVFDAGKLQGDLVIRLARPGERLLALNGRAYELDAEMTVIADAAGVQSLGGVIGGEASGCTEATSEVLIEAALFDPVRTAATGRKLNIASDARYRFERGVDPAFVRDGLEIATRLALELCGGEASEIIAAGAAPEWRRRYVLHAGRTESLGGLAVPPPRSDPRAARFCGGGPAGGRSCGRAAFLARRYRRRGRSCRGGAADRRLRQDPGGAAAARGCAAAAGARPGLAPRRTRAPHAGRARSRRDGRLLLHLRARGRAVRRRPAAVAARQSDQRRARPDAALAAAGADRRGAPERRSRLCRCGPVRARSGLSRRHAGGPSDGRRRPAQRPHRPAPVAGAAAPGRSV